MQNSFLLQDKRDRAARARTWQRRDQHYITKILPLLKTTCSWLGFCVFFYEAACFAILLPFVCLFLAIGCSAWVKTEPLVLSIGTETRPPIGVSVSQRSPTNNTEKLDPFEWQMN